MADGLTLVGPNSSGKTNILRAIQLLFTGHENELAYERDVDLTFGVGREKTSLLATFDGDPLDLHDGHIYTQLDELHSQLGTDRQGRTAFTLSLQFSAQSNPSYQFFPNVKKPPAGALRTAISRTERQLTRDLLASFRCHYVPSAKSIADLYRDLLVPHLRQLAARALHRHLDALKSELDKVATDLTSFLRGAGIGDLTADFSFPNDSAEALFTTFDLHIADPGKTPMARKGQGIQSTVLLAGLLWISVQESVDGVTPIWLMEEPESYLHPELLRSSYRLLNDLQQSSQVVVTTHSLGFVPPDPELVLGVDLNPQRQTTLSSYRTFTDATRRIRESLGVRFSDYFNFGSFNLLVEGPSDRELIQWARDLMWTAIEPGSPLAEAEILDFGGVSELAGFLRATYPLFRDETAAVVVFDGDEAGDRRRRELQSYFGNKNIPFAANRHFVSVRDRFSIEGLFPDAWVRDLHAEHPTWFNEFAVDSSGDLLPFRIKDSHKAPVLNWLKARADGEDPAGPWSERWRGLLKVCDDALRAQEQRLTMLATWSTDPSE